MLDALNLIVDWLTLVVGVCAGTVKYYAQIRLQVWQNKVCTGQGNLP